MVPKTSNTLKEKKLLEKCEGHVGTWERMPRLQLNRKPQGRRQHGLSPSFHSQPLSLALNSVEEDFYYT